MKASYPDALLLLRLGDFHEAFDGDAVTAARELGVRLTSVPDGKGTRAPMTVMTAAMAEDYTA